MALTVISIWEERATNRCHLINTFKRKKIQITQKMTSLKDIAYFPKNYIKNYYLMIKQMKDLLWITGKHNNIYLCNKNKE